jgi:hypothetical protein
VPYPSEENSAAVKESLEKYQLAVKQLSVTLSAFQRPLNKELANTTFQQSVKSRVEGFRQYARTGGLEIDSTSEFQLGFDTYANTLPQPELVPVLDYELEAIDHLLRTLVNLFQPSRGMRFPVKSAARKSMKVAWCTSTPSDSALADPSKPFSNLSMRWRMTKSFSISCGS